MDERGYFHRVTALTPTRFWINNPTIDEARFAIEAGAVGCTTNPTYVAKMLATPSERDRVESVLDAVLDERNDCHRHHAVETDTEALAAIAGEVQRRLVAPISSLFLEMYDRSGGAAGFVSIQADPFAEETCEAIVQSAHLDRRVAPNIIAKVPVTDSGLAAIRQLAGETVPLIATEVLSVSQALAACSAYRRGCERHGTTPPFYVTNITGIFDEYVAETVARASVAIEKEILQCAGTAVARRQLHLAAERSLPGVILGGGARTLSHFTEFVGEPMHVTINWKGFADELIRLNPPVVSRAGCPIPDRFLAELLMKIDDFRRAFEPDGLAESEFKDFGPVVRFRSAFQAGWQTMLDAIRQREREHA